ncbi:MAG: polysaccharide deacetylase family protein [Deltaproteobacteria bacterium]|nr:polysaccharide deacetylase family protein [Deltaproteobacteria bacterium]
MPPTLAQRLGFAPDDRVAVIHCDDIGMCHAANVGAFEALSNGPATCGSIMVPCPWFEEAAALARANPDADLGVHLTLTAEWMSYRWGPVASRDRVPSLLDADGYLPRTALEVAKNAKPEEVEIELRAQIEKALAAGVDVTHIDSHMGTVFLPQLVPVYTKLASEYRVPAFAVRPDAELLAARGLAGAEKLFAGLMDRLEAAGSPILDAFDAESLDFPEGEGLAHNRARIARLVRGVTYLICHPARDGEELRAAMTFGAHHREFERGFYGGEAGRAALAGAGVRTLGMRALRTLMRG